MRLPEPPLMDCVFITVVPRMPILPLLPTLMLATLAEETLVKSTVLLPAPVMVPVFTDAPVNWRVAPAPTVYVPVPPPSPTCIAREPALAWTCPELLKKFPAMVVVPPVADRTNRP